MEESEDLTKFFQSAVDRIEDTYDSITELFGDNSMEDGLFSTRASLLHQFAILASAYHQLNTLDFLANTEEMSTIFEPELQTANYRTRDYEHKAIQQTRKIMKSMEEYLETVWDLSDMIIDLYSESEEIISYIDNSYYENIINSVMFYLQEINTRILEPAARIIQAELQGSEKILNTIDTYLSSQTEITSESIARMCEVMSWGLEIPPGWKSIQSDTSELTGDLEKKIGSLKALSSFYRPS